MAKLCIVAPPLQYICSLSTVHGGCCHRVCTVATAASVRQCTIWLVLTRGVFQAHVGLFKKTCEISHVGAHVATSIGTVVPSVV